MRYIFVFLLPVVAATVLFYASLEMRQEAHRASADFLILVLSEEADAGPKLHKMIENGVPPVFQRLTILAIGTMICAAGVASLAIPTEYSIKRKIDMMTAMVAGFCVAKGVIGFSLFNWLDFWKAMIPCLALAAFVVWLRSAIRNMRNNSTRALHRSHLCPRSAPSRLPSRGASGKPSPLSDTE